MTYRTFMTLTTVHSDGKENRIIFDENGKWKFVSNMGHLKFRSYGKTSADTFHHFLNLFTTIQKNNFKSHSVSNIRGYWFFKLFVAGVSTKYQTGPVLLNHYSPFAPLDCLLKKQTKKCINFFTDYL